MIKHKQNIPYLRFTEFKGEWERKILKDISENIMYGMNSSATEFDGVHKYIRITDIDESSNEYIPNPLTSPEGKKEDKYKLKDGDIVFTRTGASVGKPYLYNEKDGDLFFAGFLIKFSIKKGIPYFIFIQSKKESYAKWVQIMSMRSGQPGLNAEEYKKLKFDFPTLPEQQKIATFLTAVDTKIQQLREKQDLLKQYKKGVMQRIFSQEIRFKREDGTDFGAWRHEPLNKLLSVSKKRNKQLLYGKEHVLSVSGEHGIINQIEFMGRSYAGKSVALYHVVEKGDIVYTKSPLKANPYGIIKVNKDKPGIVSTLYAVYKVKEKKAFGLYLDYYFQLDDNLNRYLRPLVRKGAKNDMKINNEYVLHDKIYYPPLPEQKKVATFLTQLDKKINQVGQQLEEVQAYKKGLLQQMFV